MGLLGTWPISNREESVPCCPELTQVVLCCAVCCAGAAIEQPALGYGGAVGGPILQGEGHAGAAGLNRVVHSF
jgi:hypothetical protein